MVDGLSRFVIRGVELYVRGEDVFVKWRADKPGDPEPDPIRISADEARQISRALLPGRPVTSIHASRGQKPEVAVWFRGWGHYDYDPHGPRMSRVTLEVDGAMQVLSTFEAAAMSSWIHDALAAARVELVQGVMDL